MVLPPKQVPHLAAAGKTGNNHFASLHPHPHVHAWYEERVTVPAELPFKPLTYPYPLSHRDLSCELYISVAPFRMEMGAKPGLLKEYRYPLLGDPFHFGA